MRALIFLSALVVLPHLARGAACCLGGTPKSFISLQKLQSYEVGLATSYRSVYGQYSAYGDVDEADANETLTMTVGAGARLSSIMEAYAVLPFAYQRNGAGVETHEQANLGDALVGTKIGILQNTFQDDWYPAIYLLGGIKIPTGAVETPASLGLIPGTGNGLWEPYTGLLFQKGFGAMNFAATFAYTFRIGPVPAGHVRDGDRIDTMESFTFPFSRRINLGFGSTQSWTRGRYQNGQYLEDSDGRVASLFITPTVFITSLWSVTGVLDYAVPFENWGVNEQAATTMTLIAKYDFF